MCSAKGLTLAPDVAVCRKNLLFNLFLDWRLTPIEFLAVTGGLRPRPSEMGLEGLMGRFPDGG
ncbi:MAG: phage tail assembly chaperone [Alphaproteobacteria bacterium]|nr:phage tail assembly chaperone [Alphaproteobacteria bacterium]MBU1551079.1 phage tail assembly chaperone [Alphaproteobacteria bacterium]MBU2335052.1 phage tail assembly chaperone [Alphaproteobacteria bacterium]MBU2388758.1 phage tail assembly chaperone [Alphaproteobacteria bacterium]